MPSQRLCPRIFIAGVRRASLAVVILAVFSLGLLLSGKADGARAESPSEETRPQAKASLGPRDTDFNSRGYKVCKVVRMERSLNALGIVARFGKTNKVGKYVELPKWLEPSERGEHFIVTWKYSARDRPRKTTVRFEYKLSNEEHLQTVTREYPDLKRGRYRLQIENTGESYRQKGRVQYWRLSIFADAELVARKESFLWPVFQGKDEVSPQQGA